MPISGVSFSDGLISIEKLQRMCDNDDYLYSQAVLKPRGILKIEERVTDYSNGAGPGTDSLFSDLICTPYSNNRVLAVWLFVPVYKSDAASAVASSIIHIQKDGIDMQVVSTDKKYHTDKADETSIFVCAIDLKPSKLAHTYKAIIDRHDDAGEQLLDLSDTRPAQFWVEDLGDAGAI